MVLPDDDVIEASDADDMARLDETLRHLDVFPTRCRVPARMVMHGDETRRRQFERLAEHVARMDDRRIEPADEQRLAGDQLVLRVQIQANEMFLIQQSEFITKQFIGVLRRTDCRRLHFRLLDVTETARERREQLLGVLFRHAYNQQ